ncbi:MAG: globin [Mariprofundaceae bacterium]
MPIHKKANRVHESYIRAGGKSFVTAFYVRLMEASEDIQKKFENIDLDAQAEILAHSIVMSFLFVDKNQNAAARCLNNVRESHNRHNLDISPELYDVWLECMIETVSVCDPQATEELLADWHTVMSVAVEHVRDGY